MNFDYYIYRLTDTTSDPYDVDSYTQIVRQVYPINADTQKKTWTKDDKSFFFREGLSGNLVFKNTPSHNDFTFFNDLQSDDVWKYYRHLFVIQDRSDSSIYVRVFFSITDGEYDLDTCSVSFKTQPLDKYSCIKEKEDVIVNVLDQTPKITVTAKLPENLGYDVVLQERHHKGGYYRGIYYEKREDLLEAIPQAYDYPSSKWCTSSGSLIEIIVDGESVWCYIMVQARASFDCEGGAIPTVVDYTALQGSCNVDGTILMYKNCDAYERLIEVTECLENIPQKPTIAGDWRLIYSDCNFNIALWVEMTYTELTISNGRTLKAVIEKLVEDCGFEFKSTFLYFEGDNKITGETNKLNNLIVFQKSDVKRPNASNDARILDISLGEFMDEFSILFNGGYFIDDDNYLRWEHIHFFENGGSYDLANTSDTNLTESGSHAKFIKSKSKYSYDKFDLPEKERWEILDGELEDFKPNEITYDFGCVDKGNILERNTAQLATDIFTIYFKSEYVSDQGMVLLQCNGDNELENETGVLSNDLIANGHLSIANLLNNYWKYNRPFNTGTMNKILTTFESTKKIKKQTTLSYQLCSNNFDPDKLKTTELGDGEVQDAEQALNTGVVDVNLMYEL